MNVLFYCLFLLFFSVESLADTADEYDHYIDQMIPLTFDLAGTNAGLKEQEVLLNLLSVSQTELSHLDESLKSISDQANLLLQYPFVDCPKGSQGELDIPRTLGLIFQTSQLSTKIMEANQHLANYQKSRTNSSMACEDGFQYAHFGSDDFRLLTPKIDLADGIYVSMGNPFKTIIDLISSFFNLFNNASEQSRIEQSTQRFDRERAQDRDLQLLAKQTCDQNQIFYNDTFALLDEFADDSKTILEQINQLPWRAIDDKLRACLRSDEESAVLASIERANLSSPSVPSEASLLRAQLSTRGQMQKLLAVDCSSESKNKLQVLIATAEMLGMGDEKITLYLNRKIMLCEDPSHE